MISYDPDKVPSLDKEAMAEGLKDGRRLINIICDDPGAKVGDASGVSFYIFSEFLPRTGEVIQLEDKTFCQVHSVRWKVWRVPGSKATMMSPNIYAVRISPDETPDTVE